MHLLALQLLRLPLHFEVLLVLVLQVLGLQLKLLPQLRHLLGVLQLQLADDVLVRKFLQAGAGVGAAGGAVSARGGGSARL